MIDDSLSRSETSPFSAKSISHYIYCWTLKQTKVKNYKTEKTRWMVFFWEKKIKATYLENPQNIFCLSFVWLMEKINGEKNICQMLNNQGKKN